MHGRVIDDCNKLLELFPRPNLHFRFLCAFLWLDDFGEPIFITVSAFAPRQERPEKSADIAQVLIAVKAVYWFDVPNHVLTIPSVIPMIPGVLMYRSLLAFINMHGVVGEVTHAFYNGINSALIIFCISLGVAVPNIFARRYIAKDRHKLLEQELQKRRERGKFIEW